MQIQFSIKLQEQMKIVGQSFLLGHLLKFSLRIPMCMYVLCPHIRGDHSKSVSCQEDKIARRILRIFNDIDFSIVHT